MVSSTTPGSLRQSYFTPEGLRFSRLASCPTEEDATSHALTAAEEVRRTRQYLTTTRQMNRDETLEALLLTNRNDPPALAAGFTQQLQADAPLISASAETTVRLAARLGLPEQGASWFALLCIAIARGMISDCYRPPVAARYHWLRRLGKILTGCAALVALLGAAMTMQGLYEADQQQKRIDQSERSLRLQTERKRDFEGKIKVLASSQPAVMKEADALYRKYAAGWPDIDTTAQIISHIFADFPLLSLDRFAWNAHTSATAPSLDNEDSRTNNQLPTSPPKAETASAVAFDGRRWQIIELTGRMQPFAENYRQALEQVDQLTARLARLPRTKVSQIKQPLDVTPQGQISQNETGDINQGSFVIRIIIAPAGGAQP